MDFLHSQCILSHTLIPFLSHLQGIAKESKRGRHLAVTPLPAPRHQRKSPKSLKEIQLDHVTFKPGDQVYVVLDEKILGEELYGENGEEFVCEICNHPATNDAQLLECGKCLGGYHMHCLNPPLKEFPEGDWICPSCSSGRPPRFPTVKCPRARLLDQHGLGLARITSIWRNNENNEIEFRAQWYYLPQETHIGRQNHHIAREVFLARQFDTASVQCIVKHANVISMADYLCSSGEICDDTFVCDYEYDPVWLRFRRWAPWDALGPENDGEDDWDDVSEYSPSDSDDEEDDDDAFTMEDALMDVHERRPGGGRRGGGGGGGRGGRKARQGGLDFTIQLGARAIPEHARDSRSNDALSQVRYALTLASTPTSLPCRENEHQEIESFVKEVLTGGNSGRGKCLYVSGIPGTGKTATVLQVMRTLREAANARTIPHFQFVDINGLRLPSPQHAYSSLYEALTGNVLGPRSAVAALEEMFATPNLRRRGQHTVVLLDELDSLMNKTQTVLYNLFDWPSRQGSNLTIIGIANTMDLPERMHPRIGSRLGGNRLVFHPYQRDQLNTIMESRLGTSAFEKNAIQLITGKVANCSGDVRRCLELCRRAAEIATKRCQDNGGEGEVKVLVRYFCLYALSPHLVFMRHIVCPPHMHRLPTTTNTTIIFIFHVQIKDAHNAIQEAFTTPHAAMVRESSWLERLLLAAIVLETRYTGKYEVVLENVALRLTGLCDNRPQPFTDVLDAAMSLAARKIILCDGEHSRLKVNIALNVPTEDLIFVLTDDDELPWLAHRLK